MRSLRTIGLVLASCAFGTAQESALAELLDGVTTLIAPGVPGPLVVHGEGAFVVATAKQGERHVPVVAATVFGRGRIVVFGHGGYLHADAFRDPSTRRLLDNALGWVARDDETATFATLWSDGFRRAASDSGLAVGATDPKNWPAALDSVDVIVSDTGRPLDDDAIAALRGFVQRGGGLVLGGLGWGWQQLNPDRRLPEDHPWHPLLIPAGLAFADGYVDSIDPIETPPDHARRAALHAGHALASIRAGEVDDARCAVLETAVRALPADDAAGFRARVNDWAKEQAEVTITEQAPLSDPAPRLVATMRHLVSDGSASPHATDFPGAVPAGAPEIEATVDVDLSQPGWVSTGTYAAPGRAITVEFAGDGDRRGVGIRIGCHTDRLWHKDAWQRFPEISVHEPLRGNSLSLRNPFGGAVYVTVPRDRDGTLLVRIRGAVAAPRFVRDETPLDAWHDTLRHHPAPWAELEGRHVVLSVPSEVVRDLSDPQALMEFWDRVLEDYADLGARPLDAERQRVVTDRQISAGYMHSGYPIMMHLDVRRTLVDVAAMKAGRHGGVWGFWHELGHNHQRSEWTFEGTVEVTCNLFSLFVHERLTGTKPIEAPQLVRAATELRKFLDDGAPFDEWKRRPFLALLMYAQVQDAFGWRAFRDTFAAYRDAPKDELPSTDSDRRDQWLVRLSRTVGRDLGPFFDAWGVPTSPAAKASLADLPDWMPESMRAR